MIHGRHRPYQHTPLGGGGGGGRSGSGSSSSSTSPRAGINFRIYRWGCIPRLPVAPADRAHERRCIMMAGIQIAILRAENHRASVAAAANNYSEREEEPPKGAKLSLGHYRVMSFGVDLDIVAGSFARLLLRLRVGNARNIYGGIIGVFHHTTICSRIKPDCRIIRNYSSSFNCRA